jgi:hypothetical protein
MGERQGTMVEERKERKESGGVLGIVLGQNKHRSHVEILTRTYLDGKVARGNIVFLKFLNFFCNLFFLLSFKVGFNLLISCFFFLLMIFFLGNWCAWSLFPAHFVVLPSFTPHFLLIHTLHLILLANKK